MSHANQGLELLESIDHPKKYELKAFLLNLLGVNYFRFSDLLLSIEYLEKSQEIVARHNLDYNAPIGNLIQNYLRLGKIDLALNLVETHNIIKRIPEQHPFNQIAFAGSMIQINRSQNNIKEALEIAKKYIDLAHTKFKERIPPDTLVLYFLYFEYFIMLLEINNVRKAQQFYNDYIKPDKIINHKDIKQLIIISEGLILINSDRLKDKIRGQLIIEESLGFSKGKFEHEQNHPHLAQIGILSLIELMLDEVRLYGKNDPINDINTLITYLSEQSNKLQNYQSLTHVKIIKSRLEVLSGNLEEASEILEEALVIASEMKLFNLKQLVLKEQKNLMEELEHWKELLENNAEISVRLEKLKLADYIKYAKQIVVEKW